MMPKKEINNAEKDITSKIGSRDIVTKVDTEVQDIIKSTILSYFPNHKFLLHKKYFVRIKLYSQYNSKNNNSKKR
jgi:fructose-1,6-bisphosphatase/inositol monophosphatase family enzyme